jgi:hypothetical protein
MEEEMKFVYELGSNKQTLGKLSNFTVFRFCSGSQNSYMKAEKVFISIVGGEHSYINNKEARVTILGHLNPETMEYTLVEEKKYLLYREIPCGIVFAFRGRREVSRKTNNTCYFDLNGNGVSSVSDDLSQVVLLELDPGESTADTAIFKEKK